MTDEEKTILLKVLGKVKAHFETASKDAKPGSAGRWKNAGRAEGVARSIELIELAKYLKWEEEDE